MYEQARDLRACEACAEDRYLGDTWNSSVSGSEPLFAFRTSVALTGDPVLSYIGKALPAGLRRASPSASAAHGWRALSI